MRGAYMWTIIIIVVVVFIAFLAYGIHLCVKEHGSFSAWWASLEPEQEKGKVSENKLIDDIQFYANMSKKQGSERQKQNEQLLNSSVPALVNPDAMKKFLATASQQDIDRHAMSELYGNVHLHLAVQEYEPARKLLEAAEARAQNVVDLHFVYNAWIDFEYRQRDDPEHLQLCIFHCIADIEMYPEFKKEYSKIHPNYATDDGFNIRIPAFQRLAIIYEKQGEFQKAIEVCKLALSYGLDDGTKGGFEGRIAKLVTKMNKHKTPKRKSQAKVSDKKPSPLEKINAERAKLNSELEALGTIDPSARQGEKKKFYDKSEKIHTRLVQLEMEEYKLLHGK